MADGVGGYRGGAEAAQATVDGFKRSLIAGSDLTLSEALQRAARVINTDLRNRSANHRELRGMGSTVVLCVIKGNHAMYGHVGDSRAYLLRDSRLQQLTRDHSLMERMVADGILTPAQAMVHPNANMLTRALGHGTEVSLDIAELVVRPGEAFLLCSDGLWGYVGHEKIEAVARSVDLSPDAIADNLLNLAIEAGGGDNISIQFIRFEAVQPTAQRSLVSGLPWKKRLQ